GGAYIPMGVNDPPERILGILEDSQAPVLVTRPQYLHPKLEQNYKGQIIEPNKEITAISAEAPAIKEESSKRQLVHGNMNSLAYIIYTSGSTGKPKGAMIEHIGMMNHIYSKVNDLRMTSESIVVQNASYTFDISVWQLFAALAVRGKTLIYQEAVVLDPDTFITRLIDDKVTILEVVPSYLSMILDTLEDNTVSFDTLDCLMVTGETVKPALVERWFEKYPDIKMVNAYGPTEASDDITHHIMEKAEQAERVPIGKTVQNFNIYIVDENMNLCPIGVKGEICVSGIGVGRGYLNDAEKTANVFKEDPFCKEKGVRLYLTGDVGRRQPDGTIDFFGRKDYQVKVRGFRIELGEIESKLAAHPNIKEAAVIVREIIEEVSGRETGEDKYICAYVVPTENYDEKNVRKYLEEKLPAYMVPTYITRLEEMP
ncbi:MAG: amino acid adenylation domain-containing protein, partial [bacterium]|nr:amino acid adenylation domain-containing protein [bacterium]